MSIRLVGGAAIVTVVGGVWGQPVLLEDPFEAYGVGSLPGGPWGDVSSRIVSPTVASPTAAVIETTDAFGLPTRAIQTVDSIGTSSGVLSGFSPVNASRVTADVRIDQFTNVRRGATWSAAVGFLQDTGSDDFNTGPQAVVYAAVGAPEYRVFVKNDGNSFDFAIPGAAVTLDSWVTIDIAMDAAAGSVVASVSDPVSGQTLGEVGRTFDDWSPAAAQYDAVAFFDGEYNAVGGTQGGLATLDNVVHTVIPAPGGAAVLGVAGVVLARRRRG
ncbi:MAG: hypothetical protein AAF937_04765 [Planctomycetota bacterium]